MMHNENSAVDQSTAAGKTDVFISYSSKDRDSVEMLANALTHSGFTVWWDRALLPGDSYEASIERALAEARAVVVCWTENSVHSDWVRSEADDARVKGKLCPVMLEECRLPKPFDRVHTENLSGWRGNRDHHGYQELEEAVRARVEGRVAQPIPWRRKWITRGALISVLLMAGVAAANIKLIKDLIFPPETVSVSDVEAIVARALAQAGASGVDMSERDQDSLRDALQAVLASSDKEKAGARAALAAGRIGEAADSLADVAKRQAEAAGGAVRAAAQSWREAGALYTATDTRRAVEAYEASLRLDPDSPDAANGLANLYERQGKMKEAEALYSGILENAGKTDPIWRAKALGNLGLMAEGRGEWQDAESKIRQAMEIFEEEGDQVAVTKALINLGKLNQETQDWDASRKYSERGLASAKALGSRQGEATALANIGFVDMMTEDFPSARRHFEEAAAIMEAAGLKTELGLIYINLTRMLSIEGKDVEAEAMARKALSVAQEMDARMIEGGAYNHLGNIARDRGDFQEADGYQRKAIQIFKDLNAPQQLEQQYRAWGLTAEAEGDLDEAIARFGLALETAEKLPSRSAQANVLLSLARLNAKAGRMDEAAGHVEVAEARYAAAGDELGLGDAFQLHGQILASQDRPQDAVNAFAASSDHYKTAGRPGDSAGSILKVSDIALHFGDLSVAESAAREALDILADGVDMDRKAMAFTNLAEVFAARGDLDGAQTVAEDYLAAAEASGAGGRSDIKADALAMMARIARNRGDKEAARKRFDEAIGVLTSATGEDSGGRRAALLQHLSAERDGQP